MGIKNENNPNFRKILVITLTSIIVAALVYFSVMSILSPVRKLEEINEKYIFQPDAKNKVDEKIYSDSAYLKLLKEKSFLQSRIAMAESDSIYVTINIPDSTIDLEICGVVVHTTKIQKMSISNIIKSGNEYIISSMLSKPFSIENSFSTIPKEPLMIKMAPKDTSEYQPDVIPDTANYEPVNYVFEMSNGTRIFVYQAEFPHPGDKIHLFRFDMKYRLQNSFNAIKSVAAFKVPVYHPFIKIRIPRADAKIIYRALPVHGQIAVYR
ncbi:MAG: hypothetical protein ABSA76_03880 [Bacteroidales bacterium]